MANGDDLHVYPLSLTVSITFLIMYMEMLEVEPA